MEGGAWVRSGVRVGCARVLSLISVLDPGWLWVGGMMDGGMVPLGYAVRPLGLQGPSTRGAWRQERAWSWPRCIW